MPNITRYYANGSIIINPTPEDDVAQTERDLRYWQAFNDAMDAAVPLVEARRVAIEAIGPEGLRVDPLPEPYSPQQTDATPVTDGANAQAGEAPITNTNTEA